MSNQGTIRLKVTNSAPAIEKLWNNRFKLEFFCDNNSPKEDWYYENVSALLPDYGILQTTNFGSGVNEDWEAIPDSVYPDMCLVLAEYPYNVRAGKHYVKLTYETLTASWVEEKAEDTDYELNGLKRVSRTFVALPATTYDKVVGTSTIESNGTTLYLGGFKIEETDAKWSLSEIWLESGKLSREENPEDAKGSISISQIGGCPAAPEGYTVVNESKNNTQGFETCSRTFYKDDSELSRSNDYVGSQLAESIEVFSPTVAPAPTNGTAVLGNKSISNVDGIPTTRYTFLVPSVLSESSDKVGSQSAITVEAFNEVPPTPAGYILANTQASDVEGIVTNRYTFLKPSILSQSEDKVGSQLAITIEAFEDTPATPAGYVIANKQISEFEGIKTNRYTFLKPSILSRSEDKVGSQLAITIEAFGINPTIPNGYSLANEQVSNVGGVPTTRYTYLKPNILSQSSDKVGSQLAITIEAFGIIPETPTDYSLANTQESDYEGIKTNRYTFLKPSILSLTQDFIGEKATVSIEAFSKTKAEVNAEINAIKGNHVLVSQTESDFDGIKTTKFNYEIDLINISSSRESNLLTLQETKLSINDLPSGNIGTSTKSFDGRELFLGQETINNNNSIKTRIRFWMEAGILNETEPAVGADHLRQKSITWQGVEGNPPEGFTFAGRTIRDVSGFPTIVAQYYKTSDITGTSKFKYSTTQKFAIPGTVGYRSYGIGNFRAIQLSVTPPYTTNCLGTVTVFYDKSPTQDVPSNFYQINGGVGVSIEGIGYYSRPFASTSSYSNHIKKNNGAQISSRQGSPAMCQGNPLYNNTTGRISISGESEDPAGRVKTVSVTSNPVFRLNGDQYYRHEKIELTIPGRVL